MSGEMANRRGFLRRSVGIAIGVPCAASVACGASVARAGGRDSVLGSLLARNRDKHPGQRVSNHTSMALLSLSALGSSEQHLRELGEDHLARWAPFPESGRAVDARGWREQRGNGEALFGLRALFREEIRRRGVAATLRAFLPDLLPGLGAHAFHPIIRTGYGVRFDDPEEVAIGLAYWAVTYLPLGPLADDPGPARDPQVSLAAVRATPALTREGRVAAGMEMPGGMNIAGNMRWASGLPGFAPTAAVRVGAGSLAAIARAVRQLYLGSGDDFTALHAVTGTHAYRMIEPFVDPADRAAGRRYLWQAVVAAYVSIGAPALVVPPPVKLPGWNEVAARAAASSDDHQIKLTDIAREEARHWNETGGLYLRAAATHLGLV
jgi:hypothetical protein